MSTSWHNLSQIGSKSFTCGHCGFVVASATGYFSKAKLGTLHICPHCDEPSYLRSTGQIPGVSPGSDVANVPADIAALYREARNCIAANSHTAAVLTCRKLLAHIAVAQGATEGKRFIEYVEHLADNGFVPPNGRGWVDHIRRKGNEANHEIVLMSASDASDLLSFLEMLLKFIYEFPSRVPAQP